MNKVVLVVLASVWIGGLVFIGARMWHSTTQSPTPTPITNRTATQYFDSGLEYSQGGEYQKAIANYSKAINLAPQNAMSYKWRGDAYHLLDQHEKALKDFTAVIRIDPQNAMAYKNRSVLYEMIGQQNKADADKKKACELDSTKCD